MNKMNVKYIQVGLQKIQVVNGDGSPAQEASSAKNGAEILIKKCAHLYCEIWREPPWREDFWVPGKVVEDIMSQMNKSDSKFFLACSPAFPDPEVVGFTWGYRVTVEEMREICASDQMDMLFSDGKAVFYIDELGVALSHRKKGLGKKLSGLLLDSLNPGKLHRITLRTDIAAIAARTLYTKIGFRELPAKDANYPDRTYWVKEL